MISQNFIDKLNTVKIEQEILYMKSLNSKEEILQKALEALRKSFDIKASTKKEIGQETANEIQMSFLPDDKEIIKNYHLEIDKPRSTIIGQLALK